MGFNFASLAPIGLLLASNIFMTFAWYGHLKWPISALWTAVLISWGIAFFEYWLAVPANRIGEVVYSPSELKTIQEVISLSVFAVFTVFYFGEKLTPNRGAGFALIGLVLFHFQGAAQVVPRAFMDLGAAQRTGQARLALNEQAGH